MSRIRLSHGHILTNLPRNPHNDYLVSNWFLEDSVSIYKYKTRDLIRSDIINLSIIQLLLKTKFIVIYTDVNFVTSLMMRN